jgi:hypothetical protein
VTGRETSASGLVRVRGKSFVRVADGRIVVIWWTEDGFVGCRKMWSDGEEISSLNIVFFCQCNVFCECKMME